MTLDIRPVLNIIIGRKYAPKFSQFSMGGSVNHNFQFYQGVAIRSNNNVRQKIKGYPAHNSRSDKSEHPCCRNVVVALF